MDPLHEYNAALNLLVASIDKAVKRGGFNRKKVLDIDWAIRTVTQARVISENHREDKKISEKT